MVKWKDNFHVHSENRRIWIQTRA